MGETTLATIDDLLAGAMDDADDAEARYKIRNARQLLVAVEHRHDDVDDDVGEAVDDDLLARLRELGYVE